MSRMVELTDEEYNLIQERRKNQEKWKDTVHVSVITDYDGNYDHDPNEWLEEINDQTVPKIISFDPDRRISSFGLLVPAQEYISSPTNWFEWSVQDIIDRIELKFGECAIREVNIEDHGLVGISLTRFEDKTLKDCNLPMGVCFLPLAAIEGEYDTPEEEGQKIEEIFSSYTDYVNAYLQNTDQYVVSSVEIPKESLLKAIKDDQVRDVLKNEGRSVVSGAIMEYAIPKKGQDLADLMRQECPMFKVSDDLMYLDLLNRQELLCFNEQRKPEDYLKVNEKSDKKNLSR